MSLLKSTIPIKGMHCRSCEILLEDALSQVPHIKKCDVDWQAGTAQIVYDKNRLPSEKEIIRTIRTAGYNIGVAEKTSFFSKNPKDYKDLIMAFLFLAGIYFIFKGLNLPGFNLPSLSNGISLPIVLLIGLAAGFSTCLALVGGLVLGAAAKYSKANPDATPGEKFRVHILFNLGRIAGYMFFGALLGTLGSVLQLSSFTTGFITVLVGAVMLIMGLQLTNIIPGINNWKLTLPKGIARVFGVQNDSGQYSENKSILLGAMTFFLPCGFTQAMQLYAISSGNFASGALIMGLFALGTAPGLLSVGGLASIFKKGSAATGKFFKLAGVVVVALALFNINNGFNLTGWSSGLSAWANSLNTTAAIGNINLAPIVNGKQIVNMTETNSGYSPNEFTVKKGITVRWVIDAQAPYSCASSIIMSKFNIRKYLQAGENIIEFTPTEIGRIDFSCSMGMYRGAFYVVDENGNGATANKSNSAPKQISGGGCGAGASGGGCGGCGGGTKFNPQTATAATAETNPSTNEQLIKTTYAQGADIQPNSFTVKAGLPVRLEITAKDSGSGCMGSIMIPGLYNTAEFLQAGQTIVINFTPTKPGTYPITCAMGVPRGEIKVE